MELRACCKINLGLRVLRKRGDGFHDIETAMIALRGLFDTVSVRSAAFIPATPPPYFAPPEAPVATVFEAAGYALDCPPAENICMRAIGLLQREFGLGQAIVGLHKRVPSGAGLGGGSSDGAATLLAADQEFALGLSTSELERLAAELGSDAAFFVRALGSRATSPSAAICTGRGDILAPVELDLGGKWIAILKPSGVHISTAEAYLGVAARARERQLAELLRHPIGEWKSLIVNDFEESIFARHPIVGRLKRELYNAGAVYASMSGSGSAVFGIFDERPKLSGLARDGEHDAHGGGRSEIFRHIERL